MKNSSLLLVAAIAASLLCASCEDRSLNSWIPERDRVFDEKLLGTWVWRDADETATFIFTKKDSRYRVDYRDEKSGKEVERLSYDVVLGAVRGKLYLDYARVPDACGESAGILLTHGIARLDLAGDSFALRFLSLSRLQNLAKGNQLKGLQFVWRGNANDLLLTSPTEELAAYLLAHGQEDGFFAEPNGPFVRQK